MWKFILLGVLLFFAWLLCTKLSLQLLYTDQFYVYLKVYFLRFRLSPKKQKLNLKQFSAKGIQQKLTKDKQKQAKAQQKKQEKQKDEDDKKSFATILDTVQMVAQIIKAIKDRFFRYLKIKITQFTFVVASDDAAKTAILYGIAVQAVQYIIVLLDEITNVEYKQNTSIAVSCDYTAGKTYFALDITLSLRVWQILTVLCCAALSYIKSSNNKEEKG
ncbi:MAG: hypothetical protein HFE77_04460 [Clostridiales bacterium]|nr:hypothetical protein [Clostridiales bacterium]